MNMKRIGIIMVCIIAVVAGAFFIYFGDYYHGTDVADEALKSTQNVNVTKIDEGYFFDGPGKDEAIIFYPGAKVEAKAYANLMNEIASDGVDCFLVDMPFNFAFFGSDKATPIIERYNYTQWAMSGHSLGGIVASSYANDHKDKIDDIVLLASYPSEKIDGKISMLSIYGDKDGVLNLESYKEAKKYWPENSIEKIISGGNHGNFGDYGLQKGDNKSIISSLDQQNKTAILIVEFLNS
ncbi:MAG: alpha/beta hydrolase [Methanobrevibacter sp.]|uniref:alpha/beta fold hydrolase n=1 Tax=Methanobrevibacter sp. TaxID=66852 RepID=UPI0026E09F0F|nr:alpha/beta fold hydrolase [Methanobrevibacter sp.]MDO5848841.1 alpha/beta hydrolase [Methanobrevibacter sp.]